MKIKHLGLAGLGALALAAAVALPASAQTPVRGGVLTYSATPGLPSLDCYEAPSTAFVMHLGAAYSTFLRWDPDTFPKISGDVVKEWSKTADRMTWTFKLKPGITFHDGKPLDSGDVKATFMRAKEPPQGVVSLRAKLYSTIASIDTPDPLTVIIKLKEFDPAFELTMASPFGCIYSAKDIAADPTAMKTKMNGTGPFKMKEYIPGSTIEYVKNDKYFEMGADGKPLPYLDGAKAIWLNTGTQAQTAMAGKQIDMVPFALSFTGRDNIKATRSDVVFHDVPFASVNQININTTKPPLNDPRVRRALNLALDRPAGNELMKKSFAADGWGLLFPKGSIYDLTDAEIQKIPGFDVGNGEKNKAEARRLLAEAGQSNLKLTLLNRNTGEPYTAIGIYVIDQWSKIGVTVTQQMAETATWLGGMQKLEYDVAVDSNGFVTPDPSEIFLKFLPGSNINWDGNKEAKYQELYDRQARATTDEERKKASVEFSLYSAVENVDHIPLFRPINIAATDAKVKGWKIMSSPTMNMDWRAVWKEK